MKYFALLVCVELLETEGPLSSEFVLPMYRTREAAAIERDKINELTGYGGLTIVELEVVGNRMQLASIERSPWNAGTEPSIN